jgi:hypothetical protein
MQWFGRCAIQPDHFKSYYRTATPFRIKVGRWMFCVLRLPRPGVAKAGSTFFSGHEQKHAHERE